MEHLTTLRNVAQWTSTLSRPKSLTNKIQSM